MQIIRGTTPTIVITVQSEIDLSQVSEIWIYLTQQKKVKVDKQLDDVTIDVAEKQITLTLSQEDTLALKEGEALFQIRLLLNNGTALATLASDVEIDEVYKGGVITPEEAENG